MHSLSAGLIIVLFVLAGLIIWRKLDEASDERAWKQLTSYHYSNREKFSAALIADLPEPVRRYFTFSIKEGTPLRRVVEVEMTGELSLGTKTKPNYRPMTARQIIAAPFGFVWKLRSNGVTGSDGALMERSWTRFWLFGLLPVAHVKGGDHRRSAFGRMVGESAFWSPASLLPGEYVTWDVVGSHHVCATMRYRGLEQCIDIVIDDEGKPKQVFFRRWSNANLDKKYRYQSFGGYLSEFKSFDGYNLPTKVVAGNHFGQPDFFAFFNAAVTNLQFPDS